MPGSLSFVTPDDLLPIKQLLEQVLVQQTAAAQPADDYLSVAQVAAATGHSTKTVRKWIAEGKEDRKRRRIRLYALEFAPGFPRVPRSALVAFGQSMGFDASQLVLPPAGAPKPAKTTRPKQPVLDSEQALRRAS